MTDVSNSSTPSSTSSPEEDMKMYEMLSEMINNVIMTRSEWYDNRTNSQKVMDRDCGYPDEISIEDYIRMFERDAIGSRVVECLPKESWQVSPKIFESEDEQDMTEFERRFKEIGQYLYGSNNRFQSEEQHPIWKELLQLDIVSRIGRYGVLLLGIDDGLPLDQPVEGWKEEGSLSIEIDPKTGKPVQKSDGSSVSTLPVIDLPEFNDKPNYGITTNAKKVRKGTTIPKSDLYYNLMYMRCFHEKDAQITRRETNRKSFRFGLPTEYQLTLKNTLTIGITDTQTFRVHWSRIISVADNTYGDPFFGEPALKCVYNDVLDARKVTASGSEGYRRMGIPTISYESDPKLGPNPKFDPVKMKQMVQRLREGLERDLFLTGMTAKPITVSIPDPSPFHNLAIERICIKLGIPIRIFKGSELASSQDDSSWNDRLRGRQNGHNTYSIVAPLVNRLIDLGVLPEPEEEVLFIKWPSLDSQSETEKTQILLNRTQALSTYTSGNASSVISPQDYLIKFMEMSNEEAEEVLSRAEPLLPPEGTDPTMTNPEEGF
jgi:Protein of unknown function (DUF1073)